MELLESDTLQKKMDFPSIGKNVIFCKKKKKNPVFFHRSSGNKTQSSQSSLPVGCEVSECASVGPGASGVCLEMEKAGTHAGEAAPGRGIQHRWPVTPLDPRGSSHQSNILRPECLSTSIFAAA